MRYRNISARRVWPWLTNSDTGRTLELDAGEEAEIVQKVTDPCLTPVKPKAKPESSKEN